MMGLVLAIDVAMTPSCTMSSLVDSSWSSACVSLALGTATRRRHPGRDQSCCRYRQ